MTWKRWIFAAILSCSCMLAIDSTILPVSLLTIQKQMSLSFMQQQWIINAYNASLAAFLVAGAHLGDRLGHRTTFILGLIIFFIASALCGLSQTGWWFILNRFIQGLGGSLLMPSMNTVLYHSFDSEERSHVIGLNLSVSSLSLLIGPLIGGALTQFISWRCIFWMNLPIALFALYCTRFLPKIPSQKVHFQVAEFLAFAFGCMGLILGLMEGRTWGWTSIQTWSLLILSILSFVYFFKHTRRQAYPFLQVSFMKNRPVKAAIVSVFVLTLSLSILLFWAIYLQKILFYSPVRTSLIATFAILPAILLAPVVATLIRKVNPKNLVVLGFLMIVIASIWFSFDPLPRHDTLYYMASLFGAALALILTPCSIISMNEVSAESQSKLFSLISTLRQFATAFGLAGMAALFVYVQDKKLHTFLLEQSATIPDIATKSYIDGFVAINLLTAALALIGAVLAFFLFQNKSLSK